MVWNLNASVREKGGPFVYAYERVCVCVFDVMFVHSVVAMASSLTPDAQENCVPIPFWPTETDR